MEANRGISVPTMTERTSRRMGVVISALAAAFTQFNALTWDGHPRLAALYGMMALVIAGDTGWRARKLWESDQTGPKQTVC